MMNFHHVQTIRVKRLKTSSGNLQQYYATATADASIQGSAPGSEAIQSGTFGKSYVAYMDADVPVQKGDMVIDGNNVKYQVLEVVLHDYGAFPHKEVSLKTSS